MTFGSLVLWGPALAFGLLAVVTMGLTRRALARRSYLGGAVRGLASALLACASALGLLAAWSLQHYHAFTREVLAAEVRVAPTGPQRFDAVVTLPDGERRTYRLAGDQLFVDARIVKWHPWANVLGLHTAYRLDRIGGRYRTLDDARIEPRTIDDLGGAQTGLDLIGWASQSPMLRSLVDAEYGSGTFAAADAPTEWEVRVSTSGLLVRPREGR